MKEENELIYYGFDNLTIGVLLTALGFVIVITKFSSSSNQNTPGYSSKIGIIGIGALIFGILILAESLIEIIM